LRATFPPGSVTGAPKVRSLRVISELEATAREAYCGAIGICSPLSGLELNVAIRTFEARDGRLWLGAGGAVVADSDPAAEVEEALAKARGVATAAGLRLDVAVTAPHGLVAPVVTEARPDPARGVLETLLVLDGSALGVDAHLARLRASCSTLGLALPGDLADTVAAAATDATRGRLRVVVDANGAHVSTGPLPRPGAVALNPVTLPGGLGAHKWADRTLIEALSGPATTPLFCDLDGHVLEAGYAAIAIVEGDVLIVPPLDGRQLPSLSRARMLAAAPAAGIEVRTEPFTLQRAQRADAVLLTSTLRGPHPGALPHGPPPDAATPFAERLGVASRVPG
jgi:para-aminobenzoate synthetase/4-amino-4-deoxychorismate lyase